MSASHGTASGGGGQMQRAAEGRVDATNRQIDEGEAVVPRAAQQPGFPL